MSLQATEACLLDIDKEGNILREEKINIDLVQRGDILKVPSLLLYFWPTVLSVEPLVQCLICLSSVCPSSVHL